MCCCQKGGITGGSNQKLKNKSRLHVYYDEQFIFIPYHTHTHTPILQDEVMFFTDSLVTEMTGLCDWFVDGKLFEEAVFGAEDVSESLLLVSCLTLHHALLAVRAGHLHLLIGKRVDTEHGLFD